jgi:hypothetical protein
VGWDDHSRAGGHLLGRGRRYVIERELTVMAELEAIVADYLQQVSVWDAIPATGPCYLLAELREQDR